VAVGAAALAPGGAVHAARSCEEWSAEVSAVEGLVEIRRHETTSWVTLATGERVCTGDSVHTGRSSRATLRLPDGGIFRVDEDTVLNLPEPPSGGSLIELIRGIIHVISRDPRFLTFRTPYANAGLEGTEFDLRVDEAARFTEIVVLEGEVAVTSPAGELSVPSAHVAVARDGEAPTAAPIERPIDRMRWTGHYPPLVAGPLPDPDREPSGAEQADADFFARRAAARLTTARVPAAEADIAAALRLAPGHALALALDALLALERADRATARARLDAALAAAPSSVAARLALSYLAQSEGNLAAAARAVDEALALEPEDALALTRRAELALARGDTAAAVAAATRARTLAPQQSAPLVVLGFANLRAFATAAAESAFAAAVELEPAAPLPRLGLAHALLQRGDAAGARRELELAVALDPPAALLRSYMARLYAALDRGELTATQLELAMALDPFDPTPWLYSSLEKLRANRPVEAARELRLAARKNGDRPALRSRLPLEEDLATRGAALARVHTGLGFTRLALSDGWRAVGADPGDFAGHRLLADAYSTEPRHEIARTSELLVSQLLQPANLAPVKPQLGQQNLFVAQRLGPSPPAFDELSAPVVANGLRLRASGASGGNGVAGHDVAVAGLRDNLSYSAGHYRFTTDGFRANDDLTQEAVNAFVQYRPSAETSLQAELRSTRMEHGDRSIFFNRDLYSPSQRIEEDVDTVRLGAKQQLASTHALLGSVIFQNVRIGYLTDAASTVRLDIDAYHVDVQHLYRTDALSVQSGVLAAHQSEDQRTSFAFPGMDPVAVTDHQVNRQLALYTYAYVRPAPTLSLTAGVSLDELTNPLLDAHRTNPKLGLEWRPTERTRLRAAAFETLFGSLTTSTQNAQPRLEPVQVAGFTQLLFGGTADRATVRGAAFEHELSQDLFVGWQASTRQTRRVGRTPGGPEGTQVLTLRERTQEAFLYWTPADALALAASYERGRYGSEPDALFGYAHMKTARLPIEARYFLPTGWTIGARVSHVRQEGLFQSEFRRRPNAPPALAPGADSFWLIDAFVGYRLPDRRGLLSLNADNLFDESFQYQDVDPANPSLFPERLVSFRFTLAFE
jgi:Tfp pilus assembly protein PilF